MKASIRAQIGPFVMVPVWLLDRCQDSRALHLYVLLGRYANRERRAWPKRSELMATLRVSGRSLDRAVAALKATRALETELKHRATDGAVIGVDYLLVQVDPATELEQQVHFATDGEKAPAHSATHGEKANSTISPSVTGLFATGGDAIKEELDPHNQIQEQREDAPPVAPRLLPWTDLNVFRLAWNEAAVDPIKPCHSLTEKRRRWVRACLAERPIDAWRAIFARVNASSFCGGDKGWIASFDWLIKSPDSAVKVLEGQYDDHFSETELQAAGAQLARATGQTCPHDPRCASWRACPRVIELARTLRARKAS